MKPPCRVLPHETAEGPYHMALDEALLDAVAAGPETAFFRTYEWRVPTLSLGYFQSILAAESDPRWRVAPIVRRPTGGGAIWHHHEVTYALVLPGDQPRARRGGMLYHDVHGAIGEVFRSLGVDAQRRGASAPAGATDRPFLCFADRDAEDLVLGGSKIVGSAQRRRAGAVLQHGSILLSRSPATPELPGAGDLASVDTDATAWARLLREHVPAALGLRPEPAPVAASVRNHARELERVVYRGAAWTRRR